MTMTAECWARAFFGGVALKCIVVGLNIASITIGVIYFNKCPGQYLIPYYLIISGGSESPAPLAHLPAMC
ncbi:unnamed protein product [Ranitomeya imitator]|uniref:Uncharacterized protein n=1 Tax=Ranitomeya imitator TaxID=111125 RepID=A0ABN9LI51_9NEOB|nr:unnamed protein product [Ranitomeya imitator]